MPSTAFLFQSSVDLKTFKFISIFYIYVCTQLSIAFYYGTSDRLCLTTNRIRFNL